MSVSQPTGMGYVESMKVFLTPNKSTMAQSYFDMPRSCLG